MGEKVAPQLFVRELSREVFQVSRGFLPLNLGFLYKRVSNSFALRVGVTGRSPRSNACD